MTQSSLLDSHTTAIPTVPSSGDGSRGIVFGDVPDRSYGHFFNVVNEDGVVRYLDGQPGAATSPAGYSRLWLLRTNGGARR